MEPEERDTLKGLLGGMPNAVIVEAGAHDCETMQRFLAWLPTPPLAYLAVEPDPRNIRLIRSNLPLGVVLVDAALSNADGHTTMNLSSTTWSSTIKKPTGHLKFFPEVTFDQQTEVTTVTLDTLVSRHNLPRIDLLWMDIEGAEADAIRGGAGALAMTRFIWMEVWKDEGYEGQVLKDELLEMLPDFRVIREFANDVLLGRTNDETGIPDDLPQLRLDHRGHASLRPEVGG